MAHRITRIESVEFAYALEDLGTDQHGFNLVYDPGNEVERKLFGLRVHPDCPNTQPPVYEGDYSDMLDTIDADGHVQVPEGPGLGVEYDWEFIEDNATGSVHIYE